MYQVVRTWVYGSFQLQGPDRQDKQGEETVGLRHTIIHPIFDRHIDLKREYSTQILIPQSW
jgi:hypothetical protein